jgi:hypothetical protein
MIWWLLSSTWEKFSSLDTNLAVGVLTAVTTVLVAALTVSLGRYFERKKEIESHFREKKVGIYDEFLILLCHVESINNQLVGLLWPQFQ